MDIFQIPKELIFEEIRTFSGEYGFEISSVIEMEVLKELACDNLPTREVFPLLNRFNNGLSYICTLVMLDSKPWEHIKEYKRIALDEAKRIKMVDTERFAELILDAASTILKYLNSGSSYKYKRFIEELSKTVPLRLSDALAHERFMPIQDYYFYPRALTEELLEATDWYKLTNGYQPETVVEINNILGKKVAGQMVFNAIIKSAEDEENTAASYRLQMLKDQIFASARSEEIDYAADSWNTIPLTTIVEGVKKQARLKGHKAATELLDQLNNILYSSPAWQKEAPELEKFLIEAQQQSEATPHMLLQAPHFPKNNNENIGRQWFDFLTTNGFIAPDTTLDNWLFLMGFSSRQPSNVQPVEWLKTLETARLMLTKVFDSLLKSKQLTVARINELASQCFTRKGQPMKLAKPKKENSQDADLIENFFSTVSDL